MALTYSRFDSTPATIVTDLKAAILASSDWADISITTGASTTQTTSLGAGGSTVTVTVGSTSWMTVGMTVVFEPGTAREEYKAVNTVPSATTFTVTGGLAYAHASGSVVRFASSMVKATTTRGAQMVVELLDAAPTLGSLGLGFWRQHNGTFGGGVDKMATRYIAWRATTAAPAVSTMPLHVTVSASKEHLYVSIEGPRAWETGATSTTYGSIKTYFFIADLVPYHAADTVPAVIAGACMQSTGAATVAVQQHLCFVSRNAANTLSWTPGKVSSLMYPSVQGADSVSLTRQCTIDGNRYLFPYVYVDDAEGMRGRLNRIYYGGGNAPTVSTDLSAPIGETLTYEGFTYRFVTLNNGDGSSSEVWGSLGSVANGSANAGRSVVVAIPVA